MKYFDAFTDDDRLLAINIDAIEMIEQMVDQEAHNEYVVIHFKSGKIRILRQKNNYEINDLLKMFGENVKGK